MGDSISAFTSEDLERGIVNCVQCPRLVAYRRDVAEKKRRAYQNETYWGRPVPSFGPVDARLLILGLAPGAHGANRTGRVFTGDSSGDFLYRVMHQAGFATQPDSSSLGDGLELIDARIACAVRCAPPDNKPLPVETATCRRWLEQELHLLLQVKVVVALGQLAFDSYLKLRKEQGALPPKRYSFRHGGEYHFGSGSLLLLASYHPSQQNTFTGRLTEAMFLGIFTRAREILRQP